MIESIISVRGVVFHIITHEGTYQITILSTGEEIEFEGPMEFMGLIEELENLI